MALPHPNLLPKEKEPARTRSIYARHLQRMPLFKKMWVMISPLGEEAFRLKCTACCESEILVAESVSICVHLWFKSHA